MRGQAAVEYLMTYGWAILALIAVLFILLTSGILSPSYLVAEECSFGTNLQCDAALFNEDDSTQLRFRLFNGFPYKIKITDVNLRTADGTQYFTGFPSDIGELDSGENITLSATLSGVAVAEGSVKRFSGNLSYVSCAHELGPECSDNEHVVAGRIAARIIPQ